MTLYNIFRKKGKHVLPIDNHVTFAEAVAFLRDVANKVACSPTFIESNALYVVFFDPNDGQTVRLYAERQE